MSPKDSHTLWSISPLDGRYRHKLEPLADFVSEGALIHYRLKVEVEWLKFLHLDCKLFPSTQVPAKIWETLDQLANRSYKEYATAVKTLEATTNHDVKAVEYFLRDELKRAGAPEAFLATIHFACTSEDINNLAYGLMQHDLRTNIMLPQMQTLLEILKTHSQKYADLPMLSRTHGQTATPTTLGKELAIFHYRLRRHCKAFAASPIQGKINGAVGNFNAHAVAFPDVQWLDLSQRFVTERLKLQWNPMTTQIESHDSLVEYIETLRRFNVVLMGMCKDFWSYISLGYFTQTLKPGEIGSSTMPHKVNPIDFENAEGNLGMAISLAQHFSEKLPISRWQRDLSDSTVLRNVGSFFAYTFLSYQSVIAGMQKLSANQATIAEDLDECWEVLGEAVQTVMRKFGVADAYERVKEQTRGKKVTQEVLQHLVDSCQPIPSSDKQDLKRLRPRDYIGLASKLTLLSLDEKFTPKKDDDV